MTWAERDLLMFIADEHNAVPRAQQRQKLRELLDKLREEAVCRCEYGPSGAHEAGCAHYGKSGAI